MLIYRCSTLSLLAPKQGAKRRSGGRKGGECGRGSHTHTTHMVGKSLMDRQMRLRALMMQREMSKNNAEVLYQFGNANSPTMVVCYLEGRLAVPTVKSVVSAESMKRGMLPRAVMELVARFRLNKVEQLYPDNTLPHIPFWSIDNIRMDPYHCETMIRDKYVVTVCERFYNSDDSQYWTRFLGEIRFHVNESRRPPPDMPNYILVHDVEFSMYAQPLPSSLLGVYDFSPEMLENFCFVMTALGPYMFTRTLKHLRRVIIECSNVTADVMNKLGFDYRRIDVPDKKVMNFVHDIKRAASMLNCASLLMEDDKEREAEPEKPTKSRKTRERRKRRTDMVNMVRLLVTEEIVRPALMGTAERFLWKRYKSALNDPEAVFI